MKILKIEEKTIKTNYFCVNDIDKDKSFNLIQVDRDVKEILSFIFSGEELNDYIADFSYLFVKVINGEYSEVYGCQDIPYLNCRIFKIV